MGFLIQIYMGTWHVKMYLIFHSRAQREMAFNQVWVHLLMGCWEYWQLITLSAAQRGWIHSFHGKTGAWSKNLRVPKKYKAEDTERVEKTVIM